MNSEVKGVLVSDEAEPIIFPILMPVA